MEFSREGPFFIIVLENCGIFTRSNQRYIQFFKYIKFDLLIFASMSFQLLYLNNVILYSGVELSSSDCY